MSEVTELTKEQLVAAHKSLLDVRYRFKTCDEAVKYVAAVEAELLRRLSTQGAGERPNCDYTARPCLDQSQICRCETCQNFAAQFFRAPSDPPRQQPQQKLNAPDRFDDYEDA